MQELRMLKSLSKALCFEKNAYSERTVLMESGVSMLLYEIIIFRLPFSCAGHLLSCICT